VPPPSWLRWPTRNTPSWAWRKLCEKLVPNGVFTDVKSFYDPAALESGFDRG
jgi:hypothetical protein